MLYLGRHVDIRYHEDIPGLWPVEAFIGVAQECRRTKDLKHAKLTHLHVCASGLECHPILGNYLVPMFVECKSMIHANQAFHKLVHRGEHSWTSLMHGFIESEEYDFAINLYTEMRKDEVHPAAHTFAALLSGCAKMKNMEKGQELHGEIVMDALESDLVIGNALLHLYCKCEMLEDARAVFDELTYRSTITWNTLISGYAELRMCEDVLDCSQKMEACGFSLDTFTHVSILKSVGNLNDINKGRDAHSAIVKQGFEREIYIENTLVDMYAKCGSIEEAEYAFEKLQVPDLISWTALIVGYGEHGRAIEAHRCFELMQLEGMSSDVVLWTAVISGYAEQGRGNDAFVLFLQMQEQGIIPNSVTYLNVLKACSEAGGLERGSRFHAQINSIDMNETIKIKLTNTLIDMYGKCGSLSDAQELFDTLSVKSIVQWNALITAYAHQGNDKQVFFLLNKMRDEQDVWPDEVTFLSLLSVCCYTGLVEKGLRYFETMKKDFSITPTVHHYNCLTDLLGRAGQLNEAISILKGSSHIDPIGWRILLGACRKWGDIQVGEDAFEYVLDSNMEYGPAFVMMSNIYGGAHQWEDVGKI